MQIYALDLRNIPAVESFAQRLNRDLPSLDIIIHNAAQTVKRPLEFYQHLLDAQHSSAATELICSDTSQQVLLESWPKYRGHLPAVGDYFPPQCLDRDGQQVDMRPEHSWLLKIGEVETIEMLEVFLVNAAAPFTLTSRLKPLLLKAPCQRRFVINVSAMEGQFARKNKTAFHPHTNMAKAALNMLTRTSAADLASEGIFMNSVDTGWITDEKPLPLAEKVREEQNFYPPLDIIDGAARVPMTRLPLVVTKTKRRSSDISSKTTSRTLGNRCTTNQPSSIAQLRDLWFSTLAQVRKLLHWLNTFR